MPSTRYGISPWLDAIPAKKRREFPAFRGVIDHPVVIVGGGMSGAMAAYACAAAGMKVMLVEADRIGLAGSGRATGLFSGEASDSYRELEARAARVARVVRCDAGRPARVAATVKRIGIRANLDLKSVFRSSPRSSGQVLKREVASREDAGLKAAWMPPA